MDFDLRTWIEEVEKLNELKRVKEKVDWDLEIGAIDELVARYYGNRYAVLFENIKDSPKGFKVLINSIGSLKRLACALGIQGIESRMDLVRTLKSRMSEVDAVSPKKVKKAPILENIEKKDEIDLTKFPTPKWHELDGGRYIGTGCAVITRDPDTGEINYGTYRVMLHDKNTVGFYISPGKHGRIHRDKYFARGEPCPVAMCFGIHPAIFLVSSNEIPPHMNELEFLGGLTGEPVEIVEAPVTGLPVPACAEIVVEGYSYPERLKEEGPFGEWTGYYGSSMREEPYVEVENLMYRNDPILLGAPPSKPPSEQSFRCYIRSALLWENLERAGIPSVTGVWCHEAGGSRMFNVVAIRQRYPGHSKQTALVASQCHAGAYLGKYTVVVDDDIDPTNDFEVIWAMCTRVDPEKDIEIIRKTWSGPLDPSVPFDERGFKGFNSRVVIDACRSYDRLNEFPEVAEASPELMERTRKKWSKFFEE
jgi:4-hydroxy-3-polyprenylbenzoate decarboxylase